MNKKIISAAVLLGLAGAATAVNLNQDGIGQVLLYPYFTTNGGHQTHVWVTNTTNQAKAVKVRFKEGVNSWETLDFNLYMSPYDTWTAVVFQDENGSARVGSNDTSCISPRQLPAMTEAADGSVSGGQPLVASNMTKYTATSGEPTNVPIADRLKEGYLEIIEMGNADVSTAAGANWAAAVTHTSANADGKPMPADCSVVVKNWARGSGAWSQNSRTGMAPVSGGLFGSARIIDAASGIDRAYDAVAVDHFWASNDPESDNEGVVAHSRPGDSYPDLTGRVRVSDGSFTSIIDKGDKVSFVTVNRGNIQEVLATRFEESVDALSSTMMANAIYNQFLIADFTEAETDWVVTFPTKHPYVNNSTSSNNNVAGQFGLLRNDNCALTRDSSGYCQPFNDGHAVTIEPVVYGTEEEQEIPDLNFSPVTVDTSSMSYEVNVLSFDETAAVGSEGTKVFASMLGNRIQTSFQEGWGTISFADGNIVGIDAVSGLERTFYGRPVIGFSSMAAKKDATGVLNYAELYDHKYSRYIVDQQVESEIQ